MTVLGFNSLNCGLKAEICLALSRKCLMKAACQFSLKQDGIFALQYALHSVNNLWKASQLFNSMERSTTKGHRDLQEEITKLIKGSWAFGAMDRGVEDTTAKSPGHFSLCWEERERDCASHNEKKKHANQMKNGKGKWRSPALMKWIICQKYSALFNA